MCEQNAKDEAADAAKRTAASAEAAAESAKGEAKGFGARLWGRGQVRVQSGRGGAQSSMTGCQF